ncbi:phosphatidylglycerophosphatase B [Actinoplanes italicus]|uniref:Undecaprenyl-diphosphatase n=1 Tax=Actinoplanes italicus TaxID=113567 RepID=A0A2T0KCH3_9ACTN|nr:phosphatase PAP2 family protein [Actinoplanes italicus]PRX20921.1 undecaprenyl-diphosphatase [Actinoplanes italicus]GIE31394.1 phosphatidylglycerophosphatase B [Actinoplanes italicus]
MRPDLPELRAGAVALVAVLPLIPFALIAVLVSGGWEPLHEFDRDVTDALNQAANASPLLTTVMTWLTYLFHPNVFRAAALVLVIWLVRRRARRTAAWVAVTMIAGGLLGGLLKLLFERARPELPEAVASAVGYAFPSGHALNSVLGVAVFVAVFPRLGWLWIIPPITALTRVFLGVHWTSDVIAGLLLGAAVPAITLAVFRRFAARTPQRVPDGEPVRQL